VTAKLSTACEITEGYRGCCYQGLVTGMTPQIATQGRFPQTVGGQQGP